MTRSRKINERASEGKPRETEINVQWFDPHWVTCYMFMELCDTRPGLTKASILLCEGAPTPAARVQQHKQETRRWKARLDMMSDTEGNSPVSGLIDGMVRAGLSERGHLGRDLSGSGAAQFRQRVQAKDGVVKVLRQKPTWGALRSQRRPMWLKVSERGGAR